MPWALLLGILKWIKQTPLHHLFLPLALRERDCFIFLLHCFIFKTWIYLAYANSWINNYWVLDHRPCLRLYVCDLRSWGGPYRCQAREWTAVIKAIPSAQGGVILGKPDSWYMSRRWVLEIGSLIRAQGRFWLGLSHRNSMEVIWLLATPHSSCGSLRRHWLAIRII